MGGVTGGARRGAGVGPLLRRPLLLGVGLLLGACTGAGPADPEPAPPPPPAACLLDLARFAATTGLTWTPDASTAGDTRCVYDPSAPTPTGAATTSTAATATATSSGFVTVEITDAADELDAAAALCEPGTSTPVGAGGFTCRFTGGGPTPAVFAAVVRDGRLVTVTASGVPDGTTADRLTSAFAEQLA